MQNNLIYTYEFPLWSASKESACNVGDLSSIPGLGRSPGEGKGYSLQYPDLENSMDCVEGREESDMTEQRSHIYISHFAVYLKLTQHFKSTIFQ